METLEQLNAFSAEEFEHWLDRRLRDLHDPDKHVRYEARYIPCLEHSGDYDSYVDAFDALFRRLAAPAQENFREALYQMITKVQVDEFPYESMRDLMLLAFITKDLKTLGSLPKLVVDSRWGKEHPSLIWDSASLMMNFEEFSPIVEELKKKYGFR